MRLTISGIKSLKKENEGIDIGKITIITGQNSSGKSSLTSAIKLISNYLKNSNGNRTLNFFHNPINPKLINLQQSIKSISNGNDLVYKIKINNNDDLELSWIARADNFELKNISFNINGLPIVQKNVQYDQKNLKSFGVGILLGNLPQDRLSILVKSIEILIEARKKNKNNSAEHFFRTELKEKITQIVDKNYKNFDDKELLIKLSMICNFHIPVDYKLTRIIEYINNGFIDKAVLSELFINENDFIDEVKNIILKIDSESTIYHPIFEDSYSEHQLIRLQIAYNIGRRINDNSMLLEYFKKAEGLKTLKIKVYNDELGIDEYDEIFDINLNGNYYILSLIFYELIEFETMRQLDKFKKIEFEIDNIFTQDDFFIDSGINSTVFNASKFFYENKEHLNAINGLIEGLNVGSKISVIQHLAGRAYTIHILNSSGKEVNIANLGSGHFYIIRLIFVMMKLVFDNINPFIDYVNFDPNNSITYKTLLICEPEVNLHPNLQSQLCDLIIKIAKYFHFNFIIETHSEYIIRRLQLNIAQKNIENRECKLYFLENHDGNTHIRRIRLDENGFLLDKFGSGFLDESQNIIEELFKTKQN